MTMTASVPQIDVFFGEFTDAIAKVYVRAVGAGLEGATLSGTVRGPLSEFSQTLPCDAQLVSLGEGDSQLSAATLPDPCGWTARLPMLYEVDIRIADGEGQVVHETRRTLGLRSLGGRGKDIYQASERLVLRGAKAGSLAESQLAETAAIDDWHDADAAMIVNDPSDGLCAAASRRGVLLIAVLDAQEGLATRLRSLAHWPAVAVVALTSDAPVEGAVRQAVPNLLFAERVAAGGSHGVADWAELVLCAGDASSIGATTFARELPVLAVRSSSGAFAAVADARRACDQLQAELASSGDFAGYFV